MTVTVASTTDTEAEVKDATNFVKEESKDDGFALKSESVEDVAPAEEEADDAPVETVATVRNPTELHSLSEPEESEDEPVGVAVSEEETESVAPEESEPQKRKRRRRGRSYKDRASQLAREKAAETLRANTLEAQLNELRAARSMVASQAPAAPPPEAVESAPAVSEAPAQEEKTAKPTQEDFETYDAFQEAMVDWKVSERLEKVEAQQRDRIERDRAKRAQDELVAAHTGRIDAFRTAHPDFDAVIDKGKNLPLTRPMQDAVVNSESGPALMYYLCQNPEECDRIAGLHPMMAIKALGRLEAHLETAPTGPVSAAINDVTKAPRPIKPVGGGATASTVPLDQMSYRDYKRARDKEEASQRG